MGAPKFQKESQESLETVIDSFRVRSIASRDYLGPVQEWIELRLSADPWIVKRIDQLDTADLAHLRCSVLYATIAYSGALDRGSGIGSKPYLQRLYKERASKAINKLVEALRQLEVNPSVDLLIEQDEHMWLKQFIIHEQRSTPESDKLLGEVLTSSFSAIDPDPSTVEALRKIWESRRRLPKALDLLSALGEQVGARHFETITKHSPRNVFLRELWSRLETSSLKSKRLTFVDHVDVQIFPGHWAGDISNRRRELDEVMTDLKTLEKTNRPYRQWLDGLIAAQGKRQKRGASAPLLLANSPTDT